MLRMLEAGRITSAAAQQALCFVASSSLIPCAKKVYGLEVERIRRVPIGSILGLDWGYMGMMETTFKVL